MASEFLRPVTPSLPARGRIAGKRAFAPGQGVLAAGATALLFPPRPTQKGAECRQFAASEGDFESIWNYRLVVLGDECLHQPRPHQQGGSTAHDREEIAADHPKPLRAR